MDNLKIQNFGPIGSIDIDLGDLTFLVGPQASGKSLSLEVYKLIEDRDSILYTLENHSFSLNYDSTNVLNAYFGEGMHKIWKGKTKLVLNDSRFTKKELKGVPDKDREASVLYIPAQRVVCMENGYPKYFSNFEPDTPYVLREFSQLLRVYLQYGISPKSEVFPPVDARQGVITDSINNSVFHDGEIKVSDFSGKKKFILNTDGLDVPFMAWSAGQKEFMPLLLGFNCVYAAPSKLQRKNRFKTVIIEEPEMGLHPKAIESVLLQILQILGAGYKVIVSTHSSLFLEFAWAFNTIRQENGNLESALKNLFELTAYDQFEKIIRNILNKSIKTYYFNRTKPNGKIKALDISSLDVMSEATDLAEWGGIMDFSTRANDVVSKFS